MGCIVRSMRSVF